MVAHTCNSGNAGRWREKDQAFKISFNYTRDMRTAWAT